MLREGEQNPQTAQASVSSQASVPGRENPQLSESTEQEQLALFSSLKRYFYSVGVL